MYTVEGRASARLTAGSTPKASPLAKRARGDGRLSGPCCATLPIVALACFGKRAPLPEHVLCVRSVDGCDYTQHDRKARTGLVRVDRDPRAGVVSETAHSCPGSFSMNSSIHVAAPSSQHRAGWSVARSAADDSRRSSTRQAPQIHYYNALARIAGASWVPCLRQQPHDPAGPCSIRSFGAEVINCWKTTLIQQELIDGWQQRARPIRPKKREQSLQRDWCMW